MTYYTKNVESQVQRNPVENAFKHVQNFNCKQTAASCQNLVLILTFEKLSGTQILREINVKDYRHQKTAILTYLESPDLGNF